MSNTLIIKAGETAILDKSKKVLGVYYSGNSFAQTECSLPVAGAIKCYSLDWAASQSGSGGTRALDAGDGNVYLKAIVINGVRYNFPSGYNIIQEELAGTWINANISPGLMKVTSTAQNLIGARYELRVFFQAPELIGPTVAIVINAPGFGGDPTAEFIEYAYECSDCCPSESN